MGRREFESKYGICFREIIERLTQKPRITIVDGHYIAILEGFPQEIYRLGPVLIGRKEAIRKAVEFFKEQYVDMVRNQRKPASASSSGRHTGLVAAGGEWPWLVE